jgi:hypothetical protein
MILDGGDEKEGWERIVMWRSKWYDMYLGSERLEAMGIVWGMMAWLMRKIDSPADAGTATAEEDKSASEKMDLS